MIILILINILLILYVYKKYYQFSINNTTRKIEEEDAITLGYIQDNGIDNNVDLILAEMIELNIKKYIIMEYSKESLDKYNYTIKLNISRNSTELENYELLIIDFLFSNKIEITKKELEEKLRNTFELYNIQFNEMNKILNNKLIKQGFIDVEKQNEIAKVSKNYKKISTILIIILCIMKILFIPIPLLYILIYILETLLVGILMFKASNYTNEGQSFKSKIEKYKNSLKNKEFLTNNTTMEEIVLDKEFANSIALHINTQAKEILIDNSIVKNAIKISKRTAILIFMSFVALILLGIIIATITILLPKGAVFWLYLIIVLIIAGIADVTLTKKK